MKYILQSSYKINVNWRRQVLTSVPQATVLRCLLKSIQLWIILTKHRSKGIFWRCRVIWKNKVCSILLGIFLQETKKIMVLTIKLNSKAYLSKLWTHSPHQVLLRFTLFTGAPTSHEVCKGTRTCRSHPQTRSSTAHPPTSADDTKMNTFRNITRYKLTLELPPLVMTKVTIFIIEVKKKFYW